MPGVRLKGCERGNGDGQTTTPQVATSIQRFCECPVCKASRWLRLAVTRGQLAPAQESACREMIRAAGGDA